MTHESHPAGPQPQVAPSHDGSQNPQPPPQPVLQPHMAWQSM